MEKTIGELRVRTEFNPSKDGTVDQIKQKTAELINQLEDLKKFAKTVSGDDAGTGHVSANTEMLRLIALAQTTYEEAAMWAVKAATC